MRKEKLITVRVTAEEMKRFKKDAAKRKLSLSAHVVNLLVTFDDIEERT